MALRLDDKQAIVAEVNAVMATALSAVLADYRGMKVSDLTSLRRQAREAGVYLRVVRNTLARKAVQGTEFECLDGALTGPNLIALSKESPGAAARLIKDFAKTNNVIQVRALAIGGKLLGPESLDQVAKLPTKAEALSMLLSVMSAPIAKLARTLNEVPGKLVRTIAAVREQKEAAAG